jgi:hypothetical protein
MDLENKIGHELDSSSLGEEKVSGILNRVMNFRVA